MLLQTLGVGCVEDGGLYCALRLSAVLPETLAIVVHRLLVFWDAGDI